MIRISATDARNNFADLLNRVAYGGEDVLIEKRGEPVAMLTKPERKKKTKNPRETAGTLQAPSDVDIEEIFDLMKEPYDLQSLLGR